MAISLPSNSKGGRRRSLDAELNLVPFIDLLSMCICFLLMTAVWVQTGGIDVKQSHGTSVATPKDPKQKSYEMDLAFSGPTAMQVSFKRENGPAKKTKISAATLPELLVKLGAEVKTLLASTGEREPFVSAARIASSPGVNYGDLVSVMDELRKQQVNNIGVMPPGSK